MVRYRRGTRMKKVFFSVHMSSIHPAWCVLVHSGHTDGAVGGCWLHWRAVGFALCCHCCNNDILWWCTCCCCCCYRNYSTKLSVICNRERDGQPTSTEIHYVVWCCCHAVAVALLLLFVISNDTSSQVIMSKVVRLFPISSFLNEKFISISLWLKTTQYKPKQSSRWVQPPHLREM